MSFRKFLELPEELQISIARELDGRGLLALREASAATKRLIDGAIELRYQLELACAGMINGPLRGAASTHDRLRALRAYRTAWMNGAHALYHVDLTGNALLSPNAASFAWEEREAGCVLVRRLPGAFRGVEGWTDVLTGWQDLVAGPAPSHDFFVSAEQDLVVHFRAQPLATPGNAHISTSASEPIRPRLLADGPGVPRRLPQYVELVFYSLSGNFAPHPLASVHTVNTRIPYPIIHCALTGYPKQVLGDLISWCACTRDSTTMFILNWKTGVRVWSVYGPRSQHSRLLTDQLVAVVDAADFTVRLYRFDARSSTNQALSAPDDCLCTLELPPRAHSVRGKRFDSVIGHPPSQPPDGARPLFMHDPALTVLTLDIMFVSRAPSRSAPRALRAHFLLFIPLETINSVVRTRTTAPGPGGSPEQPSAAVPPQAPPAERVVPWDEWGPSGTRMVRVADTNALPSALGAQVSIWGPCAPPRGTTHTVTVYEVFPLANADVPPVGGGAGPAGDAPDSGRHERDDDELRYWSVPVETTYPYRTSVRVITPDEAVHGGGSVHVRDVRLAEDGLAVVHDRW